VVAAADRGTLKRVFADCREAGMEAFLVKPFRADDVRHLVDSLLLRQRTRPSAPDLGPMY